MAKANGIIGSLLWKSGERIMVQGIGLLVQIILARLLMPEDFASLAIITAIVKYLCAMWSVSRSRPEERPIRDRCIHIDYA